jgi:hypothetical protein
VDRHSVTQFSHREAHPFVSDLLSHRLGNPPLLLPVMFRGNLPRLRKVFIPHSISWDPGILVNLTSLKLSEGRYHAEDETVTMATFPDLLEYNPLLETLKIDRHGPVNEAALNHVLPLSKISKSSLDHTHSSIILSHFALPPFTDISIINTHHYMYELGV